MATSIVPITTASSEITVKSANKGKRNVMYNFDTIPDKISDFIASSLKILEERIREYI
jgi:hypothetical protein